MSLHPQAISPIPDLTTQVARAAFRKGNIYIQMRDGLGMKRHGSPTSYLGLHFGTDSIMKGLLYQ